MKKFNYSKDEGCNISNLSILQNSLLQIAEEKNISLYQIAKEIDSSYSSIHRALKEDVKRLPTLMKIAEYLECEIEVIPEQFVLKPKK